MTALTQLWDDVEATIIAGVQDKLPDTDVLEGWPGDGASRSRTIWPEETSGDSEVPVMQAGRHQRDDMVTTTWHVEAFVPGGTITDARAAVSEMVAAFDDYIADNDTLGDLDGVVEARFDTARRAQGITNEGAIAFAQVTTVVHCRLH